MAYTYQAAIASDMSSFATSFKPQFIAALGKHKGKLAQIKNVHHRDEKYARSNIFPLFI